MNLMGVILVETLFVTPGYGWLCGRDGYNYSLVKLDDPNLDLSDCASLSICSRDYECLKKLLESAW